MNDLLCPPLQCTFKIFDQGPLNTTMDIKNQSVQRRRKTNSPKECRPCCADRAEDVCSAPCRPRLYRGIPVDGSQRESTCCPGEQYVKPSTRGRRAPSRGKRSATEPGKPRVLNLNRGRTTPGVKRLKHESSEFLDTRPLHLEFRFFLTSPCHSS